MNGSMPPVWPGLAGGITGATAMMLATKVAQALHSKSSDHKHPHRRRLITLSATSSHRTFDFSSGPW